MSGVASGPTSEQWKNLIKDFHAKYPERAQDDTSEFIVGEGAYRYRLVNDWAKMPAGWRFKDVGSVAVDKDDKVYVFCRGEHPLIIFDRDGNMLDHWGEGDFDRPHGIHIGPDGMLYLADDGTQTVRKYTPQGKLLLTLGTPNKPAPFMSGDPFCRCTDIALSPRGDIYVSDGYFNARVHKYSPDGKLLLSWGQPGTEAGEFNVPHNIVCDDNGWIYVADRENHRVQVFDGNGKFETIWTGLHRASSLECSGLGAEKLFYCGEFGPQMGANRHVPNCGPRVRIMKQDGSTVARLWDLPAGYSPERLMSPHGIAIDSAGDIYIGEVSYTTWGSLFPGIPRPEDLRTLRKLVKIS